MAVLIPGMLELAAKHGSKARFRIKPQVAQPHRSLERGEADLLLIPDLFCSHEHPQERLFDEHYVCVVWKDSPLAQGELTLERYMAASHVTMRPNDEDLPVLEKWFMDVPGMSRQITVSTYNFGAIPFMVVGTDLIGTVHSLFAKRISAALPIVLKPIPMPGVGFRQAMQWHKYRTRDPGLIWLRSLLLEAAHNIDVAAH
jgi:LysR family nod box-dependent transcriptional activator